MKKLLIGTTALITAGMIVSATANAKITNNADIDNITFALSGDVMSTIAFGSSNQISDLKKNAVGDEKDQYKNFDIWSEVYLDGTATYTNDNEEAILNSVTGHVTLVDGKVVGINGLQAYVSANTKFGNIIMGDHNFTSVMGVIDGSDDDEGSDYYVGRVQYTGIQSHNHLGDRKYGTNNFDSGWDSYTGNSNGNTAHTDGHGTIQTPLTNGDTRVIPHTSSYTNGIHTYTMHDNQILTYTQSDRANSYTFSPAKGVAQNDYDTTADNIHNRVSARQKYVDDNQYTREAYDTIVRSLVTGIDNDDLADNVEARIQYNTGDLIKLNEDSKIVVGASVALTSNSMLSASQELDDNGKLIEENVKGNALFNNQGFGYANGLGIAKTLVFAGGLSYTAKFGGTDVFAVATFQHADQINMFNVSGKVGLLDDTLHIQGGMTMKTFGDTPDPDNKYLYRQSLSYQDMYANGPDEYDSSGYRYDTPDYRKDARYAYTAYGTPAKEKPIMNFYAEADYAVAGFKFTGAGHFGYQSHEKRGYNEVAQFVDSSTMEMGFAADATMLLADNVTWTMAKVNFNYAKTTGTIDATTSVLSDDKTSFSTLKKDVAGTSFGVQSVLKINF